jgi:tetratricopeptide (TPR) repeat protein
LAGFHLKFHHFLFLSLVVGVIILIFHLRRLWINRAPVVLPVQYRRSAGAQKNRSKRKELTPNERMVLEAAQKMIEAGSIIPAANMLEQSGMFREAISTLEDAKYIDEAASILLRMQKPERAAVIFVRHEKWGAAARCFIQSGAIEQAAKCFERDGQPLQAAKIYFGSGKFGDAALCFEAAKKYESAANCWLKMKGVTRALDCFILMAQDPVAFSSFKPSEAVVDLLYGALKSGRVDGPLVATIAASPKIVPKMFELLKEARVDLATKMLKLADRDLVATMLRDVKVQNPEAKPLAAFFGTIGEHNKSGILFEQLGMFVEAEGAFSAAGDTVRADYCRTRSGNGGARSAASTPHNLSSKSSEQGSAVGTPHKGGFTIFAGDTKNTAIKSPPSKEHSEGSVSHPNSSSPSHLELSALEISKFRNSSLLIGAKDNDLEQFLRIFRVQKFESSQGFDSGTEGLSLACLLEGLVISASGPEAMEGWLRPEEGLAGRGSSSWTVKSTSKLLTVDMASLHQFFDRNAVFTRLVYTNLTLSMGQRSA